LIEGQVTNTIGTFAAGTGGYLDLEKVKAQQFLLDLPANGKNKINTLFLMFTMF